MCINFQLNNAWNTNAKHVQICARFHTDSDTANIRRNKYLIANKGEGCQRGGGEVLQGRVRVRHCVTRFRFRLAVRCCLLFALCSWPLLSTPLLSAFICFSLLSLPLRRKNCNGFSAIVFPFKCVQPAIVRELRPE